MTTTLFKKRPLQKSFQNPEQCLPASALPLRVLREKKGLSLRKLAVRMGIEKTRLLRLERKAFEDISLSNLERFAEGLNMSLEEVLFYLRGSKPKDMVRAGLKSPCYVLDRGQGVKWESLVLQESPYAAGCLNLPPKTSLSSGLLPKDSYLFCLILEGQLLVTRGPQEHFFKENDVFYLEKSLSGELFNPHQVYATRVLCVCLA